MLMKKLKHLAFIIPLLLVFWMAGSAWAQTYDTTNGSTDATMSGENNNGTTDTSDDTIQSTEGTSGTNTTNQVGLPSTGANGNTNIILLGLATGLAAAGFVGLASMKRES
jgi:LPXTG-motif cell wall-anchored protein